MRNGARDHARLDGARVSVRAWRYRHDRCYAYYIVELCPARSFLIVQSRHTYGRLMTDVLDAYTCEGFTGFGGPNWEQRWTECSIDEVIEYAREGL